MRIRSSMSESNTAGRRGSMAACADMIATSPDIRLRRRPVFSPQFSAPQFPQFPQLLARISQPVVKPEVFIRSY
jgi:hypothetical protein